MSVSCFQVFLNSLKCQGEDREDIMCLGKKSQTNVECLRNVCTFPLKCRWVGIFLSRSCECSSPVHASTCSPWGAASGSGKRNANRPRTRSKELDEPVYLWFFTFRTFTVSVLFGTPVRNPEQSHFHQCSLLPDSTCRWMAQPSRTSLTNMHLTGSGREMTVFMSPMILPLP